jgi:hypothetical protein
MVLGWMPQGQSLDLPEPLNLASCRTSNLVDGVFRTSVRGWYTFAHLCFGLLFLFGHWWHASQAHP